MVILTEFILEIMCFSIKWNLHIYNTKQQLFYLKRNLHAERYKVLKFYRKNLHYFIADRVWTCCWNTETNRCFTLVWFFHASTKNFSVKMLNQCETCRKNYSQDSIDWRLHCIWDEQKFRSIAWNMYEPLI